MQAIKDNPLTSYIRHALTFILMRITADYVPTDGLPAAVDYVADAVTLAIYWAVVKYGYALCRNKILPWLDKVAGV